MHPPTHPPPKNRKEKLNGNGTKGSLGCHKQGEDIWLEIEGPNSCQILLTTITYRFACYLLNDA
jgi:hypothetical protein